MKHLERSSRRQLLRMGAALGGGILAARQDALAWDTPGKLGIPLGPYGERSPFEKAVRWRRDSRTPETGSSFTPLQDSVGTLTPSSLHYERHHAGIPTIDPAQHRLVIHGMVERPLSLSMAEIRRLPSVSRTLVLECGGNSAERMGGDDRARRAAKLWPRQLQRVDRRPAVAAAARGRRAARRGVGDRRRRRCLPDGAQHPARRKRWTTSCSRTGRTAKRFVPRRDIRCA